MFCLASFQHIFIDVFIAMRLPSLWCLDKLAPDGRIREGGIGLCPPVLSCQDSIISIELYAELGHGPLFVSWAEALITRRVCFIRLF